MFFFFASSPFLIHNNSSFLLGSLWMGSTAVLYTCDSSLKLHGSSFTGLVNSNLMYCIITYISYEVSSYMFDIWNSLFFLLVVFFFYPCEEFSLTLQHTENFPMIVERNFFLVFSSLFAKFFPSLLSMFHVVLDFFWLFSASSSCCSRTPDRTREFTMICRKEGVESVEICNRKHFDYKKQVQVSICRS